MSIEGNINTVDLASVFQMLFTNRREGILIVDGPEKKHIYFSSGGVTLLAPVTHFGPQIGLALLRERKLTPDQLTEYKRQALQGNRTLVDILTNDVRDFLDDDRTRIYGRIVEEELCEVLAWGKANFQFHSGMSPEEVAETLFPVPFVISDIDWIVLESVRRMDEWTLIKRMIPSTDEIYRSAGQAPARYDEIGGENGRLIYSLIDGQASVDEIIESSYLTKFEVCRTLAHFVEDGVVVSIPVEELTAKAAEFYRRSRLDEALKFYLRAVARSENDLDLRVRVAEVFEKAKDVESAAHHYRICAEQSLTNHSVDIAFSFYQRVAKFLPRDLDSRERIIDLYVEYRGDYDLHCPNLVEEGMNVASRYAAQGEGERAVRLLRKLVTIKDTNLSLRAQLINISLKLGNADEAIAEYEDLARQFFQRGNFESAAKIYDKILTIDGNRKDVFEKLKNVEVLITRRKVSRQKKRIFAYVAAGFVVIAATAFLYYRASLRAFDALDVRSLLESGKHRDAIAALESFQKNFPLSPILFRAAEKKVVIVDLAAAKAKENQERRQRKMLDLDSLQEKSLALVDEGSLPEALAHYREISDKAEESYLRRNKILEKIDEIDHYLKESENILAQAKKSEKDKDYRGAHQQYRKILADYPLSRVARDITLPYLVTSEPPGAVILVNGRSTELRTPSVVHVDPKREIPIDVRLEGFSAERRTVSVEDVWYQEFTLRRAPLWTAETGGPITGACAIADSAIFVGNRGARVCALRLADGKELWAVDLKGVADIEGGVVVADGIVYAGSNDMKLRAFDRGTGSVLWSAKSDGFVRCAPLAFGRLLAFGTSSGSVYGLSRMDGREIWRFHAPGNVEISTSPVTDGESIYFGTTKGRIYSLHPKTGKVVAEFQCQNAVHTSPLVEKRMLFTGCDDGQVYAFDLFSGRPMWKFQTQGKVRGAITHRNLKLYFGSEDGHFYVLDMETGQLLHRYETGSPTMGAVAFGETLCYVACEDGSLHALEFSNNLAKQWQTQCGGPITGELVVAEGILLVPCHDGKLYAFDDGGKKIQ